MDFIQKLLDLFNGTYLIELKQYKPSTIYYSRPGDDQCITCQDYSEIDTFAKNCALQALWDIKLNPDAENPELRDEVRKKYPSAKYFDGTLIAQAMSNLVLNVEHDSIEAIKKVLEPGPEQEKAISAVRKAHGRLKTANISLRTYIMQFWRHDCKNQVEFEENVKLGIERMQELQDKINVASPEDKAALQLELELVSVDFLRMTTMWKRLIEDNGTPAGVVASCLWAGFLKARKDCFIDTLHDDYHEEFAATLNDNVAKARLLYSWLAYSVQYDYAMLKQGRDVIIGQRPLFQMIATGKEICRGYADLFAYMFNQLIDEDAPEEQKARRITGIVRQSGPPPEDYPTSGHAWSVFPWSRSTDPKRAVQHKIIDVTWAAVDRYGNLDNRWWWTSNESFRWTHIPFADKDQCVFQPETHNKLWSFSQPVVTAEGSQLLKWVDLDTVKPRGLELDNTAASIEFRFQHSCLHLAESKNGPKFMLGAIEAKKRNVMDVSPDFSKCDPDLLKKFDYDSLSGEQYVSFPTSKLPMNSYVAILVEYEGERIPVVIWKRGQFVIA